MCSILPGYHDGLRIWAVTNRGPGPGLRQQSRGRGALVLLEGAGLVRSVYSSESSVRSAWGNWRPFCSHQSRGTGLRMRALLSPGCESAGSCCGPKAPPETGGKLSACETFCLFVSMWNHAGFSVQQAKWRPCKCKCVGFGWLQGRNTRWHWETPV